MTATSRPSNRPAGAIRHGSSIGQPLTRRDGPLKVTGQARFSADNLPPGTLHAALCVARIAKGRVTGLDVAAAESVLTVVAACKSEGWTVLFSTHHMDEVDQLCDSVVVIHEGKLCFEGSVDAMRSQTGESFLDKAFLKLIRPKTEETQ